MFHISYIGGAAYEGGGDGQVNELMDRWTEEPTSGVSHNVFYDNWVEHKIWWCNIHCGILGYVTYISVTYIRVFWAVWNTLEKTGWCHLYKRILGCMTYNWEAGWCDKPQRILGCVTCFTSNVVTSHTMKKTGWCRKALEKIRHTWEKTRWCDVYWRILGCYIHQRRSGVLIYIIELWAVWHTCKKIGWCHTHRRILGSTTYIGKNWIVWHTLENSGLYNIHRRKLNGGILGCVTYIRKNCFMWHALEKTRLCDIH